MKILENFETDMNFWSLHPQLKIPEAFAEIYKLDKGKDKSSKIMWAIALVLDTDSKFFNLDTEDKRALIAKDFLKDEKFKWDKYQEAMDLYETLCLSAAKKALVFWTQKIIERRDFMKNTPYEMGTPNPKGGWIGNTVDTVDKMMGSTKKLFDDYNRVLKDLEEEDSKATAKGGKELSLSDLGEV